MNGVMDSGHQAINKTRQPRIRPDPEALVLGTALQDVEIARLLCDQLAPEHFRAGFNRRLRRLIQEALTHYVGSGWATLVPIVEAMSRDQGEPIPAATLAELHDLSRPESVDLAIEVLKARRARRNGREPQAAGPVPPELAGRRIHPGLHLEDDWACLGIIDQGADGLEYHLVTSERKVYPAAQLTSILSTKPLVYTPLAGRWDAADRQAWLAGERPKSSFAVAIGATWALFQRLLDAPLETLAVLGVWTVATYFHRLFPAFPRLFLTGELASGKSKAQSIIAGLAWNGLYRVAPNGPPLFRIIEALRATYSVSEAEHIDGEHRHVFEAIINEGYVRGGYVDRCAGDDHEPQPFEVYAPVSLGNIRGLKGVTESRAIPLVLTRGTDRHRLNADVDPVDPTFRVVRGLLHRLALERFRDVATAWTTYPDPAWLVARDRQLWRPLLVLAGLAEADARQDLGVAALILQAAKRQTAERSHPSEEALALAAVLAEKLSGADAMPLHPGDLVGGLKAKLHRDYVTPTWVGHLLRRNGFEKPAGPGARDADGVIYSITRAGIEAIQARYRLPPEEPTDLHTPQTATPELATNAGVGAPNARV